MDMPMPASPDWSAADWISVAFAWALMMAAMMVPASWPLLKLMQRYGNRHLLPLLSGYLAMWTFFSLLATALQWLLSQTTAFDPLHQRLSSGWSALILTAAALYQLTPFKQACLHRCQSPFTLLMTRWRADVSGSFRLGLYHGSFCVGCCWLLMLVLFALGAMNVYWAAALALVTGAERLLPPPWPGRLLSAGLLLAAVLVLLQGTRMT
jgi:predicted metal-binding membrane protein